MTKTDQTSALAANVRVPRPKARTSSKGGNYRQLMMALLALFFFALAFTPGSTSADAKRKLIRLRDSSDPNIRALAERVEACITNSPPKCEAQAHRHPLQLLREGKNQVTLMALRNATYQVLERYMRDINNAYGDKSATKGLIEQRLRDLHRDISEMNATLEQLPPELKLNRQEMMRNILREFMHDPVGLAILTSRYGYGDNPTNADAALERLRNDILANKDPQKLINKLLSPGRVQEDVEESISNFLLDGFAATSGKSLDQLVEEHPSAVREALMENKELLAGLCPEATSKEFHDLIQKIINNPSEGREDLRKFLRGFFSERSAEYQKMATTIESILDIKTNPPPKKSRSAYEQAKAGALKSLRDLCTSLATGDDCADEKELKLWLGIEYLEAIADDPEGAKILDPERFYGYGLAKLTSFKSLVEKLRKDPSGKALLGRLKSMAGQNGGKNGKEILRYIAFMSRAKAEDHQNIIENLNNQGNDAIQRHIRYTTPNGNNDWSACPETSSVVSQTKRAFEILGMWGKP